MPTVQTNYLDARGVAFAGMIANQEETNVISKEVQTAAIPFGRAVKQGTLADQVQLATAQADLFRGIAIRDQSAYLAVGGTADQVPVGHSVALLTMGVVWVVAGATCTVGTQAYMLADGRFTSTVGTNLLIPRGTFDNTVTVANDLVKLRIG